MPPNPSTPGSFEETMFMQTAYDKAVNNVVSVNPTLIQRGYVYNTQTDTQSAFKNLLGSEEEYNKVVGKDTLSATPDVVQRVVSHLLETNKGINNLIRLKVIDPKDAVITIGGCMVKLSTKISDPKSEDARILAWYFENVANNPQKVRAFDYINNAPQSVLLTALLKARKAYDEIVADPKNFKIGDSSVSPIVAGTQIGRLQQKLADVMADKAAANVEIAKPVPVGTTVDVSMYREEVKQARTEERALNEEIAQLDAKRDKVKGKLDEVFAVPGVVFSGIAPLDTVALSAGLDKATLSAELSKSESALMLGTTPKTLKELLTEDETRSWTDDLASTLARVGTKAPTAGEALERVMGSEYRGMLPEDERRAAFTQKLRATMLAVTAGANAKEGVTAAAAAGADDVDASTKDTSWLGGAWNSLSSYMGEEGSSFLGVYTQPTKDKK